MNDPIKPIPPRGGPEPAAQEVVLNGPFKGFNSDSSQWFLGPGGILQDCSNVDFLRGQIQSRPGMVNIVTDLSAVGSPSGQNYPSGTTPYGFAQRPSDQPTGTVATSNILNIYSPFWMYESGTYTQMPTTPPTTWDRYQFKYTTGTASNVGTTQVLGNATAWTSRRFINGYFKHDADADSAWRKIVAVVSATELTLESAYPTGHALSAYTIALPIVEEFSSGNGYITDSIGYVRPSDGALSMVIAGAFGSRYVSAAGISDLQASGDLPRYKANCCAIYGNRMFLGTDVSAVALNTALIGTAHGGRVVYSKNGDYSIFSTSTSSTAGVFDLEGCSSVRWLVVLRDILYAFSKEGIYSIQKTGNSALPFRTQKVVTTNDWPTVYKPVSVNGSYAYLMGYDAVYRFDGSSIEEVEASAAEWIKGNMYTSSLEGYPDSFVYDRFRDRVIAVNPLANAKPMLLVGTHDPYATKYTSTGSSKMTAIRPWYSVASSLQDDELIATVGTQLVSFRRATTTDAVPSASTAIAWSATSPVLDTSTSRDMKSCNRIRITYEVAGTSADNITVELFIDGGTSAAVSGTLDVGGAANGVIANGYLTFAAKTGQQWCVKVSGSSSKKVKINQIALYFIPRQEAKPT